MRPRRSGGSGRATGTGCAQETHPSPLVRSVPPTYSRYGSMYRVDTLLRCNEHVIGDILGVGGTFMARRTDVLELAVLGLLHESPLHGYELRKRLNGVLGAFRALSYEIG